MAMHIRPDSSLAHSGFSSTVMENNSGQMLAKPRPAANDARERQHFDVRHQRGDAENAEQGGKAEDMRGGSTA